MPGRSLVGKLEPTRIVHLLAVGEMKMVYRHSGTGTNIS
jgi:hypothetical protein